MLQLKNCASHIRERSEKSVGKKTEKRTSPLRPSRRASRTLSEEERDAMRERLEELRAGEKDGEARVLAKIAEMPDPDRKMAESIHALVQKYAPELTPRTWYGMPAYARGEKVVCFFQGAHKFKARYATLGFTDAAHLDEGPMWPTAYALKEITPEVEARIRALILRAVGKRSEGS